MADHIARFRVELTGWNGAPGVNTWHFVEATPGLAWEDYIDPTAALIRSAYNTMAGLIASGVKCQVLPEVDLLNIADGQLVRKMQVGTLPTSVTGTGSASAIGRVEQVRVKLVTDKVVGRRLLQGRHFIGPMAGAALSSDGTLSTSSRGTVATAYQGVTDALGARLAVWARPGGKGATDGEFGHVQSVVAGTTPGVLRSRRD